MTQNATPHLPSDVITPLYAEKARRTPGFFWLTELLRGDQ